MKNSISLRRIMWSLVLVGSVMVGAPSRANTINIGANPLVVPFGGGFNWTYSYTFASSFLATGDYMTINDFGAAALVVAPVIPGGAWAFSQDPVATGTAQPDNGGVLNVTFTWGGGPVAVGSATGTFTLFSTLGVKNVGYFETFDHQFEAPALTSEGGGQVFVPVGVPDGGLTLALLGFAFVGVEGLRRKLKA